jgi:hypothetical protein
MNPRDFRKAAPYLGVLLLAALVFIVVFTEMPRRGLLGNSLGESKEAREGWGIIGLALPPAELA